MNPIRFPVRHLAAAALLCVAGASQAAITVSSFNSAASFQGGVQGSVDTFGDLTINQPLPGTSASRNAGSLGYLLSTSTNNQTDSGLYVAPVAGAIAITTNWNNDTLTLSNFVTPIYAIGANFYGTNILGEVTGGGLTVVATDTNGLTLSTTLTGGSTTGFLGLLSDTPFASVTVGLTTPSTNAFASLDNVVMAVPESGGLPMALLGGALLRLLRKRRNA